MRLHCPKCADAIPARDVNIRNLVAKCERCDNVFSFRHETVAPTKSDDVAIIKRPQHINRKETSETLTFSWSWRTKWALPVFITSILFFWWLIRAEFQPHSFTQAIEPSWFNVIVFSTACLYGVYWAVAHTFNQTIVEVEVHSIRVVFVPLPWRGEQTNYISRHMQLYSGKYLHGGRHPQEYICVNVLQENGNHVRVIEKLDSAEHALYLEQEIEAFLGIVDQPVRGELSRGL